MWKVLLMGLSNLKLGKSYLFKSLGGLRDGEEEEVSVTFQGKKAGGMIRRLFETDGLDETAIDDCELPVQEHGRSGESLNHN